MSTAIDNEALIAAIMAGVKEQISALQASFAGALEEQANKIALLQQDLLVAKASATPPVPAIPTAEDPPEELLVPDTQPSRTGLTPANTLPAPPSMPQSERLPDPPMFNGRRRDLPLFITKLRFKLEGNADRYPNERAKLIYAHSRLEHDPATLVDPMLSKIYSL